MAGDIGGLKASMVSVKEEIAGVREILDDHITTTKSNFDKLAGGQQELRDILLARLPPVRQKGKRSRGEKR